MKKIILIVFIFYFPTLFYAVKAFDELLIFKETYLPVPFSFSEIPELISNLGLHQYVESSNTLYSTICSLRCNPLGNLLQLFIQFLFQKNPFNYHLYALFLHLINTALVFLILNKSASLFSPEAGGKIKLFLISVLTILWSTHPVNIESVLLITNANITLSYGLSLLTFYLYLRFSPKIKLLSIQSFILFIIFLSALLIAEFHFMLPFILLSYAIAIRLYSGKEEKSLLLILPVLLATAIYMVLFLASNTKINFQAQPSLTLIFERVFWLSPQILFHFIKLLFLPIKLSVDQTFLVKIADSLFAPYAVFCTGFVLLLLVLSIFSLFNTKRKFPFFFIIFFPFLLSLLPYSQAIAPVYNLASERYLYFPSFILIFGISHLIFFIISNNLNNKKIVYLTSGIFLVILISYSTRGYIRTLDWKDNFTLYKSAINTTDNPLYKAFRYKMLTPQEKIFSAHPEKEVYPGFQELAIDNIRLAIKGLEKEKQQHQNHIPQVVKSYGLDPVTLLTKAGYLLAHSDYTINNDPQRALNIINPFVKDLSLLDNAGLAFYASLHFFNKSPDKAERILRYAHKKYPYSTQITFPLCQLIYMKTGKLDEVEKFTLLSYKYFPYDTFTLLYLIKLYNLKGDNEKYAFFSYAYGLRHHSIQSLGIARELYLMLNKPEITKKIEKRIACLKMKLKNQS